MKRMYCMVLLFVQKDLLSVEIKMLCCPFSVWWRAPLHRDSQCVLPLVKLCRAGAFFWQSEDITKCPTGTHCGLHFHSASNGWCSQQWRNQGAQVFLLWIVTLRYVYTQSPKSKAIKLWFFLNRAWYSVQSAIESARRGCNTHACTHTDTLYKTKKLGQDLVALL